MRRPCAWRSRDGAAQGRRLHRRALGIPSPSCPPIAAVIADARQCSLKAEGAKQPIGFAEPGVRKSWARAHRVGFTARAFHARATGSDATTAAIGAGAPELLGYTVDATVRCSGCGRRRRGRGPRVHRGRAAFRSARRPPPRRRPLARSGGEGRRAGGRSRAAPAFAVFSSGVKIGYWRGSRLGTLALSIRTRPRGSPVGRSHMGVVRRKRLTSSESSVGERELAVARPLDARRTSA
jgi:hypothetical protein